MSDIKEAIEALKRAEQLILKLNRECSYWRDRAKYAEMELKRRGTYYGDELRYFGEVPL